MLLLRELRTLAGITQKELAEKIRSTQTTIGKYERGELEPSIDTLKLFSRIFEVSVDYIIGNSDDLGVISIANEKSPSLSKDELELIEEYRTLAPYLQEMLKATIRTWKGVPQENFQERGMKK